MFQLFLRARAHKYFGSRTTESGFKARSVDRDAETDRLRIESVISAIQTALAAAEAEQSGLSQRVEDILARASVTFGNGSDEYQSREPLDSNHQSLFGTEIANGQRRLKELADAITHLRFLKAAALSRFPDFKRSETDASPERNQPPR
jgi:hypothetical protein